MDSIVSYINKDNDKLHYCTGENDIDMFNPFTVANVILRL